MTPEDLKKALSENIDTVMQTYFPNARKRGASYQMGDLDGKEGFSTSIFRGVGKVYLAKDNAKPEEPVVNILQLVFRKIGNWKETFAECKKLCGVYDVRPVKPPVVPERPSEEFLGTMRGTVPFRYLRDKRGLTESVVTEYGVRSHKRHTKTNPEGNFWAVRFYTPEGDLAMIKSTGVERDSKGRKEIWSTPHYSTLWPWSICDDNTRSIVICEGEIDAMSMRQMGAGVPCLSVPSGCSNIAWIENDYDALQKLETIYLAFDNDHAGEVASRKVAKRLGLTRCRRVRIPSEYKDANELLLSGDKVDVQALLKDAKTYDPTQLKGVQDMAYELEVEMERHEKEQESNPFLFPELPYRHRLGELTVVGGYSGHGKSQFVYQTALNEIMSNDRKTCIASFEIPAQSMLFNMMWMDSGRPPTHETHLRGLERLKDKLWFIEGEEGSISSWDTLKEDFLYANKRFGCDLFVVDALMHISGKEDYSGQERIAKQAAKFCVDNDVSLLLICHCDAKKGGSDRVPEIEDILGGQGIGAAAHAVVMVWRNKEKEKRMEQGEDVNDEHDGIFYVCKQRANGKTVYKPMWFDQVSRRFSTLALTGSSPAFNF